VIASLLFSLFFGMLPLAVIAGTVAAVVAARREGERESQDPGIGTVRRLFVYVLALVGLSFAATGVALLIRGALEVAFENLILAEQSRSLSMALAFTLVGTPAWLVFAAIAQRSLHDHPVEARSHVRRLYFVLARGIALGFIAMNATTVGRALLGMEDFSASAWGWLLAWSGVWLLHVRLVAGESRPAQLTPGLQRLHVELSASTVPTPVAGPRFLERLYWYFGAVVGLFMLVTGINEALTAPLRTVYDGAFGGALVQQPFDNGLRGGLVLVAVGAAIWGWHWLRGLVRADRGTSLWHVQVFVFGTLPGIALTVVPLAVLLYRMLQWFAGQPTAATAAVQFAEAPSLVATLLAGAATWGYHRAVLRDAGEGRAGERAADTTQSEPERLYRYLVIAAGLVTAASGLATLLALTAEGLGGSAGSLVRDAGWWRNPLLRGLTMLAVGVPLWAGYWLRMQRTVARGGSADRSSVSRRAFVFAATGVSLLALLGSLTVLLYQVLQPLLDGTLSLAILRDARWSLAVALTAGGVAGYSLLVLREDQAALRTQAPPVPMRVREIFVIAAASTDGVLHELAQIEGTRVHVLRRLDVAADEPALTVAQLAALRVEVQASEASRFALVVGGGRYELVPLTEART
jgi:hypothetical protein